jgi:hypothetical protein
MTRLLHTHAHSLLIGIIVVEEKGKEVGCEEVGRKE